VRVEARALTLLHIVCPPRSLTCARAVLGLRVLLFLYGLGDGRLQRLHDRHNDDHAPGAEHVGWCRRAGNYKRQSK